MSKKTVSFISMAVLLILMLQMTSVAAVGDNIAPNAKNITVSSFHSENHVPENAVNGLKEVAGPGIDWSSLEEMTPWIKFEFDSVWIDKIILYDRANETDWAENVKITLSDGTVIENIALENNGTPKEVTFEAKNITWVQINVVTGSGMNVGISEVEIFEAAAPVEATTEAPAETTQAPEETTEAPAQNFSVKAPQTSDNAFMLFILIAIAAAGIVLIRSKSSRNV